MSSILSRYANEIPGNFDPSVYEFAKRIIPFGFSRLLKTSVGLRFQNKISENFSISDRIKFVGDVDTIRDLAKEHTIVMVPTHSSNLDSMVIGWAIKEMGLPAFIYGAGLNLFGVKLLAYLMNRLGAYKVDRRKKNDLYLETLKTYSTLALHKGTHSLFFPGGTRSRSGEVETKLKLGLLGTAIDAQYLNYANAKEGEPVKKIVVVPVVMNYHFILEAPGLIDEHLKYSGEGLYMAENDDYSTSIRIARFLMKFLSRSSKIYLSFAPPMDLFGNHMTRDGTSYDQSGRPVDVSRYFYSNGALKRDKQRDGEYIKRMGDRITEKYLDHNIILSSYLIAFIAFQIIKKRFKRLDIYALLRVPAEDREIDKEEFREAAGKVRDALLEMRSSAKIKLAKHMRRKDLDSVLEHGFKNLGLYHDAKPLTHNKAGNVISPSMKLLYFYNNRLEGYGLDKLI